MTSETLKFYGKRSPFSNFHLSPFSIDGEEWPTTEHYFQAMKFPDNPKYQQAIKEATTPAVAKRMGSSRSVPIRKDWDKVKDECMYKCCFAKFTQSKKMSDALLRTNDAELIENSRSDYYWGCGSNGKGKNKLGKILMRIRRDLKTS
jgi:N-glycosidase YbiA